MKIRSTLALGILFIAAGVLVGYDPIHQLLSDKGTPSLAPFSAIANAEAPTANAPRTLTAGKPVRILIPSLNIDLAVVDGYYDAASQTWTLTGDKAQYAVMTSKANNIAGNTFIYGHNNKKVFASLPKIKVGDKVTLETDNGHKFTYKYVSSYETDPTDTSLFSYKGQPILTVQTCSGLWFQNRELFTFALSEVA